jgi:site-specific recombinase XerD
MKKEPTIRQIIVEMCLYWNIRADHERKTLRGFKKMNVDIDGYLSHIEPAQLIQLYRALRQAGTGTDESIRRHYDYVKRVFTYAHAQGYIQRNPCALVKLPKGRKAPIVQLSASEVQRLEAMKLSGRLQTVRDWFLF